MKKKVLNILVCLTIVIGCGTTKEPLEISEAEKAVFETEEGEHVKIADEESDYDIIIIDPGFYNWLQSIAKPEGYYSQSFMENRNYLYVLEWNRRSMNPLQYGGDLYQLQIDYDPEIDYGYEVNYKLYNYFIYFQRRYNQRLGPFLPRI